MDVGNMNTERCDSNAIVDDTEHTVDTEAPCQCHRQYPRPRRGKGYRLTASYPFPVYSSVHVGVRRVPGFGYPELYSRHRMGISTVIKDYGTEILNCIRENNLQRLKAILEKHLKSEQKMAKLCTTDIKHRPTKKFACPLILAARQEDPRIIKYMLDKGADPNFVHHTVFSSKRREIVTALHIAIDLAFYDTVAVLLNANADCNITDHNSETPLHIAIKKADRVMTRMLLSKGADPSLPDRRGNAALHTVTLYGHLQLARLLLKYDADVYLKGQWGVIPPHIAAKEGHIHLIQLFCSHDIGNINIKIPCYADKHEKAPIHLAAENGHVETVLALLDQFSAEVNLKDSEGNTPLHCCVLNPYDPHRMRDKEHFNETARVLIKFCVAINDKNLYGDTALHLAAMNHFQRIVELLLEVGANPFVENDEHLKPIDVVPDSDPVTKQVLKMAMLQPRPTGDSVSMASDTMRKEMIGGGEFTPNHTPVVVKKPRMEGAVNVSNDSSTPGSSGGAASKGADRNSGVSLNSVGSSVFDVPLPPAPPAPSQNEAASKTTTPETPSSKHKGDGMVDTVYTKVDKKAKRAAKQKKALERMLGEKSRHGQFQFDGDDTLSTLGDTNSSISSIATEDAVAMTMDNELGDVFRRIKQQKQRGSEREAPVEGSTECVFEEEYMEMASSPKHSTGKSSKTKKKKNNPVDGTPVTASGDKQAIYANFEQIEALRKEREAATGKSVTAEPRLGQMVQVESVENLGREGDIQVHAIPGKPGLIEVQYMGGPITISVNTLDGDQEATGGKDGEAVGLPGSQEQLREKTKERGSQTGLSTQVGTVSTQVGTVSTQVGTMSAQVGTGQFQEQPVTIKDGQVVGQMTGQPGQLVLGPIGKQKPIVGVTTHGDPIHLLPGQRVAGQASYIVQGQVGHIVQGQFIPYPEDVQAYLLQQHQLMVAFPNDEAEERAIVGHDAGLNQLSNGSLSGVSTDKISTASKQGPEGQGTADAQVQEGQSEGDEMETEEDTELDEKLKQQQMLYEQRLQEQQMQIEQQQLLLLQQEQNQELLQQQQKQQEEYVQLIEQQQLLLQQQQKQELLQQKIQVNEGQRKKVLPEEKSTEHQEKQEVTQKKTKVKVQDEQERKKKQELLQHKMQVNEPQKKQQPPNAMYYLRSDGSMNDDDDYEVSPDVSPNASPHYKNFQQAMAWAKTLENKTASPGRVTEMSETQGIHVESQTPKKKAGLKAGILATPEAGHWKVARGSATAIVEAMGEDDDIGEIYAADAKQPRQNSQHGHPAESQGRQIPHSGKPDAARSTGIQEVVTEYDREPGVLQKCTLSAPATDSDSPLHSPTNFSERSSSPQSVYSEGGTRYSGLNMHVTADAPKAHSRAATASARRAFMQAKPIGIESGGEASDTELGGSRSSLSSGLGLGRQWAEPTKPVYGKGGPEGLVPRKSGSGEVETTTKPEAGASKSKSGFKLIGAYARPYKSFGLIETKTDALEAALAERAEADEALDEVFQANLRHSVEFDRESVLAAISGDVPKKLEQQTTQRGDTSKKESKHPVTPDESSLPKGKDKAAGERLSATSQPQSSTNRSKVPQLSSARDESHSSPPSSPKAVTINNKVHEDVMSTVQIAGLPTQMTMADIVIIGENDDDEDENLEQYEDEPHMIKPRKVVGMPTALAAVLKQGHGKARTKSPSSVQAGSPARGQQGTSTASQVEQVRTADQQERLQQQQLLIQVQAGFPPTQQGDVSGQNVAAYQYDEHHPTEEKPGRPSQRGAWNEGAGSDDPVFVMQQQQLNKQQQQMEQQLQQQQQLNEQQQQMEQQLQQQQQLNEQQQQMEQQLQQQQQLNEQQQHLEQQLQQQQQLNEQQQQQHINQQQQQHAAQQQPLNGQQLNEQQQQFAQQLQQQQQQQQLHDQQKQQQQLAGEDEEVAGISAAAAKKKKSKSKKPKTGKKKKKGDKVMAIEPVLPPQEATGQQVRGDAPQYQPGVEPQQQGNQAYQQEPSYQQGQRPQHQQGQQPQYQQGQYEQYQQGQQPQHQQGQQPQYQQGQQPQHQQGQQPQYQQEQPQYQQGQDKQYQQGQQPQHQQVQQPQYQQGQQPQHQQGQQPQYQQGQPQYQQGQDKQYQEGQQPQHQQGQPQYQQGQEQQYQQGQHPQYQQGQPQYQQGQPQYQQGQEPQYQQGQQPQYQQGQRQYQQGQRPQNQEGQEQQYQPGQEQQYQEGEQPQYQEGEQPQYQEGQQPQYQEGQQPQYQEGEQPQYQEGEQPQYQQGQQPQNQQGQEHQYQQGKQPQYQTDQEPQYQQGKQPQYQQGQEPEYQKGQEPTYQPGQEPQYQQGQQPQYQQGQEPEYQKSKEPTYQPGQELQYQHDQEQRYKQEQEEIYQQGQQSNYQQGQEQGVVQQFPQGQKTDQPQYNQSRDTQYQQLQSGNDQMALADDHDDLTEAQSPVGPGHDQSFDSQSKAKKKGGFWSFPSGRQKKGKGSTSELPRSHPEEGDIVVTSESTAEGGGEERESRDESQEEVKRKGNFFSLGSMRSKKKGKKSKHPEAFGATAYIEGEGEVQTDPERQRAEWAPSVSAAGHQMARETDIDADLETRPQPTSQQHPYQQPMDQQQQQPYQQPEQQQPYQQHSNKKEYRQQQQPYQEKEEQQPYQQQHNNQQQQQSYQQQEQQQPDQQQLNQQQQDGIQQQQQQQQQLQQQQQSDQQPAGLPAGPLGIHYPSDAQEVTKQWLQRGKQKTAKKPKPSGSAIQIESANASSTVRVQDRRTGDTTHGEELIPQEPMSRLWKGQGERDAEAQQLLDSTLGGPQRELQDVQPYYDLNQEPLPPDNDARFSEGEAVQLRRPTGGKPAWEKRGDAPRNKRRSYRESETDPKSDTELMWRPADTQLSEQAQNMHSEADMLESDQPLAPHDPAKPLTQVAIEALESGQHEENRVVSKPPRPMPSRSLGVYRPKPQYWKRGYSAGGDGSYDDSQLSRPSHRSMTESEGEADSEGMVVNDDNAETPGGGALPVKVFTSTPEDDENKETRLAMSAFQPVSPGSQKRVTIVDQRGRRRKRRRDLAPRVTEPGPVDFSQYGVTARLWMEQVDKKTVQKSKTMYLSVMPESHDPPPALAHSISYESTNDDVFLPPQWVIARGRSIRRKKRKFDEQLQLTAASGGDSDAELLSDQPERPLSPGRQVLLFFRVGTNWKDLAWVLFDGVQSDTETVRMIKDIQLKQPGKLTEQVHDLMNRWWTKKESSATIEELKKALDFINMAYIHEEYFDNMRKNLISYTGSEGDLDISEISDDDPDVSRLMQEYNVRSLNTSYDYDSAAEASRYSMSTENIMRKLQKRGLINRSKLDSSRDSTGRPQSYSGRLSSSRLNSSRESLDYTSDTGDGQRRSFVIVQPQLKPGDYRHETNL